jgi:pimeloyl-ACP methyl ester carboxylesterase
MQVGLVGVAHPPPNTTPYRATVELLPGVGHSPMLEDPPRTAAPLLAFTAIHAAQAD